MSINYPKLGKFNMATVAGSCPRASFFGNYIDSNINGFLLLLLVFPGVYLPQTTSIQFTTESTTFSLEWLIRHDAFPQGPFWTP